MVVEAANVLAPLLSVLVHAPWVKTTAREPVNREISLVPRDMGGV